MLNVQNRDLIIIILKLVYHANQIVMNAIPIFGLKTDQKHVFRAKMIQNYLMGNVLKNANLDKNW